MKIGHAARQTTAADAVVPHPQRRDWYLVPQEWLREIAGVPQVQLAPGRGIVHRSHLPLLVERHPEVAFFFGHRWIAAGTG